MSVLKSTETMKTPGPGSSCKIGAGSGGKVSTETI